MKKSHFIVLLTVLISSSILSSCKSKSAGPSADQINNMNLKRGEVISCGATDKQFGSVSFETSCGENTRKDFNLAIELLHSFEYDEAEKVFAKIIDAEPGCAMAYWGIAMSNYHPLWAPPIEPELKKGADAIAIAQSITKKSKREADYIDAIAVFYKGWDSVDHHTRTIGFEKAMEKLYSEFANDKDAAIFYALALDASADPADKSFRNQKKAGGILFALYPNEPDHPGIAHYIIHTYDYPGLAPLALDIARKYASIAPSSAHAQHMPSHIFTRLGLWDECITANLASITSARCYAESADLKGHWDEELHGLDYLVYAYLQKGENDLARKQWDYLQTIHDVYPVNFKVAYAFAAIPSRFVLENKNWNEAAALKISPENFPWARFPWQKAIFHFTRLMGFVHLGNIESASAELRKLNIIHDTLLNQKDSFKANQVQIQITTSKAWIRFKEGKYNEATSLMNLAAEMEDKTEKHPVTPCEVIPARELLGDMLLEMNKPDQALIVYETDLEKHPNRLNGLYGAGVSASKSGNPEKAALYFKQLSGNMNPDDSDNPMLIKIKSYLAMASSK
jgi:tetratricopeptide (TPR) repeat protein